MGTHPSLCGAGLWLRVDSVLKKVVGRDVQPVNPLQGFETGWKAGPILGFDLYNWTGQGLEVRMNLTALGVLCLAVSLNAQPSNDRCANAIAIGDGAHEFDTTGAATDGPGEFACAFCCHDEQINRDIWYEYVAAEDRTIIISLCDSAFDTKLAVYEGECPSDSGEVIACNDDFIDCELRSRLEFEAVGGARYLIRIGGFRDEAGVGTLRITSVPPTPANDECVDAIEIVSNGAFEGDTSRAAGTDMTTCALNDSADVWHRWIADCDGLATFSLCDSSFDTTLAVFDACDGFELACADDSCGNRSEVVLEVSGGTEYMIRVSGFNGATGPYVLTVSCIGNNDGACCQPDGVCSHRTRWSCDEIGGRFFPMQTCDQVICPPANDDCHNAVEIFDGATEFDNLAATTDGPGHALCDSANEDRIEADVWFTYTATGDGPVTVSTCNAADYDTWIAAYRRTDCPVNDDRILGCNDDADGCDVTSAITFDAVCGEEYLIRVGGFRHRQGAGTLTITRHQGAIYHRPAGRRSHTVENRAVVAQATRL